MMELCNIHCTVQVSNQLTELLDHFIPLPHMAQDGNCLEKKSTKNKKSNTYKKHPLETFEDIDTIYQHFFSENEEDEEMAPVSVQRLLEGENLKAWEPVSLNTDCLKLKVDDVEKQLLEVAIKEAKVISGRVFKELKKR